VKYSVKCIVCALYQCVHICTRRQVGEGGGYIPKTGLGGGHMTQLTVSTEVSWGDTRRNIHVHLSKYQVPLPHLVGH
jgi:hypothetical protein